MESTAALKAFLARIRAPEVSRVEAVDTSERTVLILCIKISGNTVCQSIRVVADGRMYRHIGRFVYDQDIFVFIKNGKRHRNRDDSVGINSFQKTDPEMISGQKLFSAADPLTVPCKSFFVSFHRREDVSGKSLLPKKVQYGRTLFIFCDLIMKNSIHNSPPDINLFYQKTSTGEEFCQMDDCAKMIKKSARNGIAFRA